MLLESFGSLLKNYSASSLITPMKIPTVEQIIRTLPHNAAATEHASDAVTPHSLVRFVHIFLFYNNQWHQIHVMLVQVSAAILM